MTPAAPRVLLVEDHESNRRLFTIYLQEAGIQVQPADTLARAEELLGLHRFDAVILDLLLPDSFGLETLEAVLLTARGAPVVVCSNLNGELRRDALEMGAAEFVFKDHKGFEVMPAIVFSVMEKRRE